LWSSPWTWGGLPAPGQGEIAVIQSGQYIYFDAASTPVLKAIIIQGGSLIFDDNQDVSLNVEYIIITDGGLLQIGMFIFLHFFLFCLRIIIFIQK
jgi:hypothetical protein